MTVDDVANELGVSPKRVREYCNQGRLGMKFGRQWIVTREEFEHFVKNEYTGKPGRPRKDDHEEE